MSMTASDRSSLSYGFAVQMRVIGALIMRELHTRYGRDNIGYLWMFLEPGLLAAGVATIHYFAGLHLPWGMQVVPFYISGYSCYQLFRACANRAGSTIEANGSLLYHRPVTIFDLLFSRTLLDASSMMSAAVLLMAASAALGIGRVPARPLLFLEAWGLNFWFGLAISMSVLAGNIVFPSLDKFVHPMVYLVLPISNVFSVYEQLPASVEQYLWWWPMAQINEIVREAVFANFDSRYANPLYVAFCCASLTLFGLVALRAVRSRIVLE